MSEFTEMLEQKIEDEVVRAQQSMVCKIVEFDKETMRATVQPLLAEKAVGEAAPVALPLLPNIPVNFLFAGGFYIRPHYAVDDMVTVTFSTHDIDESLEGTTKEVSEKVLDLANATVTGGVAPTGWSHPAEFESEDGLLIGHEDGDAYLKFEDSVVTAIFGTKKVEWSNSGMRFFNGALWTNFMTHKHVETGASTNSPTVGT